MTLHWIRHGHTTAPDDRCVGHEDVPLSETGRQTIKQLGTTWTGSSPDRVVSSDLARARASAEILTDRWDAAVQTTEQLRELDFGEWTGRSWEAIEQEDGDRFRAWMRAWVDTATPNGESFTELSTRVITWLGHIQDETASDATVVVVAHAGPIRAVLCHALDLYSVQAFDLQIDHAGVSTLTTGVKNWTVVCLNSTQFRRPDGP